MKNMERHIRAEIERRALAGDIERAANLLGYAKEVGLCLSPPDLFERELSVDPLAACLYQCRARVKFRARLTEEAVVDTTRALLVDEDVKVVLEVSPHVHALARVIPVPPWVNAALESVRHRLDGTKASEWRHLVLARERSDDVAVHVRMAQLRRGEGSELEVSTLSSVLESASAWFEGWLRVVVVRSRTGDERGAQQALERLRALAPQGSVT
jgi:hypothetical protein